MATGLKNRNTKTTLFTTLQPPWPYKTPTRTYKTPRGRIKHLFLPPPRGAWIPSLSVARAVGFLTEWLVSFRVGLGRHCGAAQSLPKPLNETFVDSPLGFGASDEAMHSLSESLISTRICRYNQS